MRRDPRKGSALIEAAIVLPIFALLVCGSVDIARTLHLSQVGAAAARAGMQTAFGSDPHALDLNAAENAALADAAGTGFTAKASRVCSCSSSAPLVSCDATACPARMTAYLRVETRVLIEPLMRYPGVPSPFTIRSEAVLRIE